MSKADVTTNEIMRLFENYGNEDYDGEPVSQTSHMIQCAMQAMAEGEDMELILGAFLHDVGHLLRHEQTVDEMGGLGAVNHEGLGGDYLRRKNFSERLCAMVENMLMQSAILLQCNLLIKTNYLKQAWKHLTCGRVDQ
jgi:predicted HD phosphohydrolase